MWFGKFWTCLWTSTVHLLCWVLKIITYHIACIHIFLFVYILYVIVAMILCVDFGANSDCDCEECSYSPNYQGKWCFMILSLCFLLCIRNILLVLHGYILLICYAWEILVVVELLEISKLRCLSMPCLA